MAANHRFNGTLGVWEPKWAKKNLRKTNFLLQMESSEFCVVHHDHPHYDRIRPHITTVKNLYIYIYVQWLTLKNQQWTCCYCINLKFYWKSIKLRGGFIKTWLPEQISGSLWWWRRFSGHLEASADWCSTWSLAFLSWCCSSPRSLSFCHRVGLRDYDGSWKFQLETVLCPHYHLWNPFFFHSTINAISNSLFLSLSWNYCLQIGNLMADGIKTGYSRLACRFFHFHFHLY